MRILIICFFITNFLGAQVKDTIVKKRNNTLTLSVGGEGFYFGTIVAYEKSLLNKDFFHLGFGVGIGRTYGLYHEQFCMPTYLNLRLGRKRHFFELNGGINHLIDPSPYPKTKSERENFRNNPPFHVDSFRPPYTPSYFITLNYVYKSRKGFVFKIGTAGSATILDFRYSYTNYLLPRLSIGYAF